VRRDAVASGIRPAPAPPPRVCPAHRVQVLPAGGRDDDVCQLLVGDARADERQGGPLGQRRS
jgi:hypothetical protein